MTFLFNKFPQGRGIHLGEVMNIKELQVRKSNLDIEIYKAVSALIKDFNEDTGVALESVDIKLHELSYETSKQPTNIVGSVKTNINF